MQSLSEIVGTMQKLDLKNTKFLSKNFDQNVYCFPQEGIEVFASFQNFHHEFITKQITIISF